MTRRIIHLLAIALACAGAAGCGRPEERRLAKQIERELGVELADRASLLASEEYGWAEEGGDRALLGLAREDCARVKGRLGEPAAPDSSSGYTRMFASRGLRPARVAARFSQNPHGDHRHYVLDPASCTLYREAHFE